MALFNFSVLFWLLRNRIGGIYGRHLASSTGRMSLAALAMGAAVFLLNSIIELQFGAGRMASLLSLAICIPAGVSVFYLVTRTLQVPELAMASNALAGPLRRLGARVRP